MISCNNKWQIFTDFDENSLPIRRRGLIRNTSSKDSSIPDYSSEMFEDDDETTITDEEALRNVRNIFNHF